MLDLGYGMFRNEIIGFYSVIIFMIEYRNYYV